GISFLVDKMATKEVVVYMLQSNSVGGLCWNHTHLINSTLHNYQSALNIMDALKTGKIQLVKEVTVVGAHAFREDDVYLILSVHTCRVQNSNINCYGT
ncbi:hypothetical protein PAXRUDRAFT_130567, partial [Paxillus rubicundulus Ve08.2h10]